MKIRALLLTLLIFASPLLAHQFYVAITQIDHNPETKSLEITIKIFTDDIEKTLEKETHKKLRLGSKRQDPKAGDLIFKYLNQHLTLQVNDKPAKLDFVGFEVELDVTWCYIEVPNVPDPKKITIRNTILLDAFDAQTNIVHFKIGKEQKSLLLHKDKIKDSVEFGKP